MSGETPLATMLDDGDHEWTVHQVGQRVTLLRTDGRVGCRAVSQPSPIFSQVG
jgi:hypothetical protein